MNEINEKSEVLKRKTELRSALRSRRRALCEAEIKAASERACERVTALEEFKKARLILSYMASMGELDPAGIAEAAIRNGARVCYPLCVENGGLRLFVPNGAGAMRRGAYGIIEPDPAHSAEVLAQELELAVIPGVAFTRSCRRLGQGGGYYDRLILKTSAVTVGLCYDFQLVEESELPVEAHDRGVTLVAAPCGLFRACME